MSENTGSANSGTNANESKKDAPVIESASATTSHDNHAGSAPYVIVVACLVVIIALALSLVSGISGIVSSALISRGYGSSAMSDLLGELGNGDGNGGLGGDRLGSGDSGLGSRNPRQNSDLTSDNVFDYELASLDSSVSDYVYATDYQGAQPGVSAFVKKLAKADADALASVQSHVRAAAATSDAQTRSSELDQAQKACTDAKSSIAALDVDTVTGSRASSITEDLNDAKGDVAERWDTVGKIVAIMKSPDGHKASELQKLDDDANDAADIASELTEALYDSARAK